MKDDRFLKKAHDLMPVLYETTVRPISGMPGKDRLMRDGDGFILDFGSHFVGYLTLSLDVKRPGDDAADAPLAVEFRFFENLRENTDEPYTGGMSRSWFQNASVLIDDPYAPIELPRRYSFRYVKIRFPSNTSYSVVYKDCFVRAVTSADMTKVAPLPENTDPLLVKLDKVSLLTLKDCMQQVFEDGPKRDRRLWLGDLYLQAKTNYYTFKNNGLVLRCLYLFAGLPHDDGLLSSAVFHEPVLKNQSWALHDYALLFVGALADYYRATGDIGVLKELWPVAYRQTELAYKSYEQSGRSANVGLFFIDWCPALDKSCAALGIILAMFKEALYLADTVGTAPERTALEERIKDVSSALLDMYSPDIRLFRGASDQLSAHSQMWAALAGVLGPREQKEMMKAALKAELVSPVAPYAMHYFVEALILSGLKDEAFALLKSYWGGMLDRGYDCFPEVFVPGDPEASPYGSPAMNSFCHAWSCTPSYFIRKYMLRSGPG